MIDWTKPIEIDGRPAELIRTINHCYGYDYVVLYTTHDGYESTRRFNKDGKCLIGKMKVKNVRRKVKKWVNIYRGNDIVYVGQRLFDTREEAFNSRDGAIDTVEIEFKS